MQTSNIECPPVLLVIFNRPDLTERSFEPIRKAAPKQLFVAADGPRPDRTDEEQLCLETRHILNRVDWRCDVKTLFREQNLGCRRGVSEAITWFFEHVEAGIILEDDCVATDTFFPFCADLLKRFRHESCVMSIAGNNNQFGRTRGDASYFFSEFHQIWGWATWRRAWQCYSTNKSTLDRLIDSHRMEAKFGRYAASQWFEKFAQTLDNQIDSWGYLWLMSCWANAGLAAIPNVNLVSNIGFDQRASHTKDPSNKEAAQPVLPMKFPLRHPENIEITPEAERFALEDVYGIRKPPNRLRRIVSRLTGKPR